MITYIYIYIYIPSLPVITTIISIYLSISLYIYIYTYVIPPDYHHNGLVANHALGTHDVLKCNICQEAIPVITEWVRVLEYYLLYVS